MYLQAVENGGDDARHDQYEDNSKADAHQDEVTRLAVREVPFPILAGLDAKRSG